MRSEPRLGQEYHLQTIPPSLDALEPHWLRTLWVADYWSQATGTNVNLLPLDNFGWVIYGNVTVLSWTRKKIFHK